VSFVMQPTKFYFLDLLVVTESWFTTGLDHHLDSHSIVSRITCVAVWMRGGVSPALSYCQCAKWVISCTM
jgi:hypothetical protein